MSANKFRVVQTKTGAVSIKDLQSGEIMHNPVGPWQEAQDLYILQSKLVSRLGRPLALPLILYDVGLGAGTNALAAINAWRNSTTPTKRHLSVVSFERDLDLFQFAFDQRNRFPYMQSEERAMKGLLSKGFWSEPGLHWSVLHGDFLETVQTTGNRAELVFYDPYSPVSNPSMWGMQAFCRLRKSCLIEEPGCLLFTYSRATPVRAAMLMSGFFVGHGKSTGQKVETTIATTRLCDLNEPLSPDWYITWENSDNPYPWGAQTTEIQDLTWKILTHPQFAACCGSEPKDYSLTRFE